MKDFLLFRIIREFVDGDSVYRIRYDNKKYFLTADWLTWQGNDEKIESSYDKFEDAMKGLIELLNTNLENGSYQGEVIDDKSI